MFITETTALALGAIFAAVAIVAAVTSGRNKYTPWRDVGIDYILHEYRYVVIQTRTRKRDNFREIRHVEIKRFGGALSEEIKSNLTEILAEKEAGI